MTLIPELEHELVTAAERRRSVRGRTRRAAALGVAAAAVLALAIALGSLWSSEDDPSSGTAADGSLVRLGSFDFRGVQYRLSGYRSPARGSRRNDTVCLQIKRTPPVAPGADRPSVMCAGDGLLLRGLRRERVLNVGAGGGPPQRLEITGFTVADVSRVRAVGASWPAHVELTRAWRPLNGPRIRAFVIVLDPPRGAKLSRRAYSRIRAVEADR
jgi:hypothetical protein